MRYSPETESYITRGDPRITLTEQQLGRYKRHGLVTVHVPLNAQLGIPDNVVIDTSLLSKPTYAWIGGYVPDGPNIVISNGRQPLPKRHIPHEILTCDSSQTMIGIELSVSYNVSPRREIPFNVSHLQPIYR